MDRQNTAGEDKKMERGRTDRREGKTIIAEEAVKADGGGLKPQRSVLMDCCAFSLLLQAFGKPCTHCLLDW